MKATSLPSAGPSGRGGRNAPAPADRQPIRAGLEDDRSRVSLGCVGKPGEYEITKPVREIAIIRALEQTNGIPIEDPSVSIQRAAAP